MGKAMGDRSSDSLEGRAGGPGEGMEEGSSWNCRCAREEKTEASEEAAILVCLGSYDKNTVA